MPVKKGSKMLQQLGLKELPKISIVLMAAAVCHFSIQVVGEKSYTGWDAFVKQNEERVKSFQSLNVKLLKYRNTIKCGIYIHIPFAQACHYCDFHFRLYEEERRDGFGY
jgi:coproporphyrinogen III oxidase-like Fe-S oxidoreductase